jgi:hypothetical protein
MIQTILIIIIFTAALGYLVVMVRKQFDSKQNGCAKGCGCSAVDLEKIEKQIKADQK